MDIANLLNLVVNKFEFIEKVYTRLFDEDYLDDLYNYNLIDTGETYFFGIENEERDVYYTVKRSINDNEKLYKFTFKHKNIFYTLQFAFYRNCDQLKSIDIFKTVDGEKQEIQLSTFKTNLYKDWKQEREWLNYLLKNCFNAGLVING